MVTIKVLWLLASLLSFVNAISKSQRAKRVQLEELRRIAEPTGPAYATEGRVLGARAMRAWGWFVLLMIGGIVLSVAVPA